MITDEQAEKAADFIRDNASKYAEAKGERIFLSEYRKSKKAILMQECDEKTQAAKETWAYAHMDYEQLLEGLKEAVIKEETLRWQMVGAQTKIELWKSQQFSNRQIDRSQSTISSNVSTL